MQSPCWGREEVGRPPAEPTPGCREPSPNRGAADNATGLGPAGVHP